MNTSVETATMSVLSGVSTVGDYNVTNVNVSDGFNVTFGEDATIAPGGMMELPRKYILDYEEYRRVLDGCNTTLHTTPYPDDGELNPYYSILSPPNNVSSAKPLVCFIFHSPSMS